MKVIVSLLIMLGLTIAYGITAIINPKWVWKRAFRTSLKVREPRLVDLTITKVTGIGIIIFAVIFSILVITHWD